MAGPHGSFPHPVLGNADDVDSVFTVSNVVINTGVEDVEIIFDLVLDDDDILELISDDRAEIRANWSCAGTLSSSSMELTLLKTAHLTRTYRGFIDQRAIRGKVEISFRLIATGEIHDYQLTKQHPDYAGATFRVHPGDVLGEAGMITFDPTKKFDPLDPPVGSCFKISLNEKLAKGFELNLNNDDYVAIMTSPAQFEQARLLGGQPNFLISLLIFPALVEIVTIVQDVVRGGDRFAGYSDADWFKAIQQLMDELPRSSSEGMPTFIAQKLLEYPTERAARERIEMNEDD